MPFQKGQSGNPKGGKLGNKGRSVDWFVDKCRKIVEDEKLIEFWRDVAVGKDFVQGVGSEGEVIPIPASIKDRLKASELIVERGFGKTPLQIDFTDNTPDRDNERIARMEARLAELQDKARRPISTNE